MPSFRGEVKPSVPCLRFAECKKTHAIYVEVRIAGKIDWPFIAQFRFSLTEVSHVTWCGAPLEMMGGTKGGAQRTSSLRPRCVGEVDPETMTHIYLSKIEPGWIRNIAETGVIAKCHSTAPPMHVWFCCWAWQMSWLLYHIGRLHQPEINVCFPPAV
jgi:hypothetical protein